MDARINRCALITGSGRNIGRAIALELAERGYAIAVNGSSDRAACQRVADEITEAGGSAVVAMGDIGNREQAHAIVEQAIDAYGAVDVLVNNAAIRPNFDLLNGDEAEFQKVMDVNFYSCFWLMRACSPGMIEKGWGRIIHFSGMNAQQGSIGKSAVSIAKHANWGLTKSIAKEFGRNGITCNIISPGTIVGEVADPAFSTKYASLKEANPSGRLGTPGDIASAVAYLVSDEGGFVNGQLLQINGGVVV
ncbi:MAG: SDR family oxidoreductase [Granulosicoccus sp.]|nr:SDR family oxidoreductase [Granulosicoccus sp.]